MKRCSIAFLTCLSVCFNVRVDAAVSKVVGADHAVTAEVSSTAALVATDKIVLTNPIIKIIDGVGFGINDEIFGLILQSRRKGRNRLYGTVVAGGQRVGMFEYHNNKYCLIELAKIEKEYEAEYLTKLTYLEQNRVKYAADEWQKEKEAVMAEYKVRKTSLKPVFEYAQQDFMEITLAYLDSAAGMKDPLMIIIKEFCEKKGLKQCFLLDWGQTAEGGEIDSIKNNINNLSDLTRLWIDMTDFLEALARSCPKAKKLFIERVKQAKESKAAEAKEAKATESK